MSKRKRIVSDYSDDSDEDYIHSSFRRKSGKIPKTIRECYKYIESQEVTLDKISKLNTTVEDRSRLVQLYEVYKYTEPNTSEFLESRSRLTREYNLIVNRNSEVSFILNMFPEDNIENRIVSLNTSMVNKNIILKKFIEMSEYEKSSDEYPKLKTWIDWVLKLPFDNIKPFMSDDTSFLKHIRYLLDERIYGLENVKEKVMLFVSTRLQNPNSYKSTLALLGPPGVGKCLAKGTRVVKYNGDIVNVESVKTGDILMGDDSNPRTVTSITRGFDKMYCIDQKDGLRYIVNSSHILTLMYIETSIGDYQPVDIPVETYLELPVSERVKYRGYRAKVDFEGSLSENFLYPVIVAKQYIQGVNDIPPTYIRQSISFREKMLNVILDIFCPGHESGHIEVTLVEIIREDNAPHTSNFLHLLHSLGLKTRQPNPSCILINPYSIMYNLFDIDVYPVTDSGEYFGFTIDGNRRFLLGDFTVTHNTMIARSLSDILHFPFQQINMGGLTDVSYLKGHDYTYIGSQPGAIVKALSNMKFKNGILFMDEFDKIGNNQDIVSFLLHLIDPIQNSEFSDNYIGDIKIDLSSMMFIMSMNELPSNSALSDRLYTIKIDGYNIDEKVEIIRKHVIKRALSDHNLDISAVNITKNICKYIIENYTNNAPGIREIENVIYDIVQKLHLLSKVGVKNTLSFNLSTTVSFPITLTKNIINELLK